MTAYDMPFIVKTGDEMAGRRVHHLMWERKITQSSLAQKLQTDQSSLAKRIRGTRGWTIDGLIQVAAALETTVAFLVGETDDPTNPKCPRQDSNLRPRD